MGSQVISFFQSHFKNRDWTHEETGELYRVEHALVQARLSVVTDRGLTDEGDPWFVFCRSDGEVLVHIARFDGEYCLYSPGLPSLLRGRTFPLLTKAFVSQIPMQVTIQRGNGARLFVHPSAVLAMLIGTIFVAADDVLFVSGQSRDPDQVDDKQWAVSASDRPSFKSMLQASFQSHIDAIFGNLRDYGTSQSAYLAIISTIVSLIVGSTIALNNEHSATDIFASAPEDHIGQQVVADIADQGSSNSLIVSSTENHPASRVDAPSEKMDVSLDPDNSNLPTIAKSPHGFSIGLLEDGQRDLGRSHNENVIGDSIAAAQARDEAFKDVPVANKFGSSTFVTAAPTDHLSHTDATKSEVAESSAVSSSSTITLLQNSGLSNGLVDSLLHRVVDANFVVGEGQFLVSFGPSTPHEAVEVESTLRESGTSSAAAHPIFDLAAQSILLAFLTANPTAEVIVASNAIMILDGLADTPSSHSVTLNVWEASSGQLTIALVGHVDHQVAA